jgi:3-oxoacyl-[acyl-carrier protein] reductase
MHNFDLVIGGSSDIGVAIISKLVENGRNVIYTYNSNFSVKDRIEASLKEHSNRVIPMKLDIRSNKDISDFAKNISKKFKISSLIYNAGKINDKLFYTMTEQDFTDVIDINLYGCFRVCKAFINEIAVNEGTIVFISSISGMIGKKGQANYSCSKAGMNALCRNLAIEYASMGVRVNCIAPGFIKTKMLEEMSQEHLKDMKKGIPLKRIGSPEDVANVTHFLVSKESQYITGQTIVVDGGLLIR